MTKLIIPFLIILSFSYCSKPGCPDKNATNYNPKLNKYNNTCTYEGSVVFWYDSVAVDSLVANKAKTLYYYIDGQLIDSMDATIYWNTAPECGDSKTVTLKRDLGLNPSLAFTFSVIDQNGKEYWKGPDYFYGGICRKIGLYYN